MARIFVMWLSRLSALSAPKSAATSQNNFRPEVRSPYRSAETIPYHLNAFDSASVNAVHWQRASMV